MSENFAALFEQSLIGKELTPGTIVKGKVLAIGNDYVVVSAGLK